MLKTLWKSLVYSGVTDNLPQDKKKHIILTNQSALTWCMLIVPYVTFLLFFDKPAAIPLISLIGFHFIAIALNKMKAYDIARLIECIAPVAMIDLAAAFVANPEIPNPAAIFVWNAALISLPFVIFSLKEKKYIIICIIVNVMFFVGFKWLNKWLVLENASDFYYTQVFDSINYGFSVSLVVICFTYLKKIGDNYQQQSSELLEDSQIKNKELEMQKEEILAQRDEIEAQRNEIINQKDEISAQKDQVVYQMEMILDQANEINQSILYARRIQNAILPTKELLDNLFSSYFIIYHPKDVVSGDFYWAQEKGEKFLIAVCDCTGHGVPGGFLSMLCTAFLNEAMNKPKMLEDPKHLLEDLKKTVINALHQTGKEGENRDGMDMSLCIIDKKSNTLKYSGANNSLLLYREDHLEEYKSTRQPIGFHVGQEKEFKSYRIQIQPNDTFYIFSDGYYDQFGGPDSKKFRFRRFQELLIDVHELSLEKQKAALDLTHKKWKGRNDQVDDILVIGFKV